MKWRAMFLASKQNDYFVTVNQIKKEEELMPGQEGMETGKYFVSQSTQQLMYPTHFLLVCQTLQVEYPEVKLKRNNGHKTPDMCLHL